MPRSARFIIPGNLFHITHRGNNKQRIFETDEDRRKYLYWFEEARQKHDVHVLAYCLMDNHVHFVAIPNQQRSFAKVINSVHARYACYLNQKKESVGHIWQGRYYSCILDNAHLLAALRYVERNPVRAGLVQKPWDWRWSSAREHLELDRGIIKLKDVSVYVLIPDWKKYIDILEDEKDLSEIRKQTMTLKAWAEDKFKESVMEKYGISLTLNPRGRPKR